MYPQTTLGGTRSSEGRRLIAGSPGERSGSNGLVKTVRMLKYIRDSRGTGQRDTVYVLSRPPVHAASGQEH